MSAGSWGLLLVGHGTRDSRGQAEFQTAAEQLSRLSAPIPVEPCFLELCGPTIAEGVDNLVRRGVTRMTVSPLLLFAAGHALRDIPRAVQEATDRYEGVCWNMAGHLGCHRRILELLEVRLAAALAGQETIEPAESLLLMVGRGSGEPSATEQMLRLTRLHQEQSSQFVGQAKTCFLAMAQPDVNTVLAEAESWPFRRIVVQPHLLFYGQLLERLRERVQQAAERLPHQQWIVAGHLGPHPLLAQGLWELARNDCGTTA